MTSGGKRDRMTTKEQFRQDEAVKHYALEVSTGRARKISPNDLKIR